MNLLLSHWFSLSFALAALAGVVVVLIALYKHRQEQLRVTEVIAEAAAASARKAAGEAAQMQAEAVTSPLSEGHTRIEAEFAQLQQQQRELEQGFRELRQQQSELAALQAKLEEAQRHLEEQTPESRFYQRAAKLVEQGATVEEVMQECELPRNEAELLISLHQRS
ncbi:DUF2802 domain-containing protein [Aliidiomarina sp. Khilg15.8]